MKKFKPENHQRILGMLKLIASSKGLRIKDLARQNGLSSTAIYNPLYADWPKGERILANILSVEPQELWASRYDSEGRRKDNIRGSKSKGKNREVKGKISDVDEAK